MPTLIHITGLLLALAIQHALELGTEKSSCDSMHPYGAPFAAEVALASHHYQQVDEFLVLKQSTVVAEGKRM